MQIPEITIAEIIDRYAALLLDAYGVLVHAEGALEGATHLIDKLNRIGKTYYIVTNDASRLPQTSAARFSSYGLNLQPEQIITSGGLLNPYFAKHHLRDARCVVMGPQDSIRYVELAGGRIVSPSEAFDVLVIGDEAGYPFVETVDNVLSAIFRKIDRKEPLHLLLPNPDLIYPKTGRNVGITSGSIAHMFEAALKQRYPNRPDLCFVRLGKPHAAIFKEAIRRCGHRNMVMIGDQPETDIRGANRMKIDSVLVTGILTASEETFLEDGLRPTYRMRSLRP